MPEIEVKNAQSGMTLMEEAVDLLGNPLFEAGAVLSANDIRTLKAWGVNRIVIEQQPAAEADNSSARPRRRRRTTRILRLPGARKKDDEKKPAPADAKSDSRESASPKTGGRRSSAPGDGRSFPERLSALNYMFEPHEDNKLMENIRKIAEHQLRRQYKQGS